MLYDRLLTLYTESLAQGPIGLHCDPRVPEGKDDFRSAAVLAAVTDKPEPGFLLIHRPANMRAHPGQIAFPGGGIDPGENAVEAALREADEELAIPPAQVRVIGTGDLYRTGSGYEITPVLGVVPSDLRLRPNPNEVSQWFEAPLDFVLDPANQKLESGRFDGKTYSYWAIHWQRHRIWGVTAALLVNLSRRLRWHG